MVSREELEAEIEKLKSSDDAVFEPARAKLIAFGVEAITPLILALDDPKLRFEIFKTLDKMPHKDVIRRLGHVLENPDDYSDVIFDQAKQKLILLGGNPKHFGVDRFKTTQCKEVDLKVDRSWTKCQLGLEHPGAPDYPCYWLSAGISVFVGDERTAHYFNPASKASVEAFVKRLEAAGFKRTSSSTMREWVYWTYTRQ